MSRIVASVLIVAGTTLGAYLAIESAREHRASEIRDLKQHHVFFARDGLSVSFESLRPGTDIKSLVRRVNALGGAPSLLLVDVELSPDDAATLATIKKINALYISVSQVSAEAIAEFKAADGLREIDIGASHMSDRLLDSVAAMTQLRKLTLVNEDSIRDVAIRRLRAARPDLQIERRSAGD